MPTASRRACAALAAVGAAAIACSLAAASAPAAVPGPGQQFVPGEVLTRFEPGAGHGARVRALAGVAATTEANVSGVARTRVVRLPAGRSAPAAARELARQPGVEWAEPNWIGHVARVPGDPRFDELWGMHDVGQEAGGEAGPPGFGIRAPGAWDLLTGGTQRVAIVDSGIDPSHPDVAANLNAELSRNFVASPNGAVDKDDWGDANQHGTHVAGTVAAVGDNGVGVAGVAWDAELVSARACDALGACTSAALAEALAYAGSIGANVANVSIGTTPSRALEAAVAAHPDTLYVAAAGNSTTDVDADPSRAYPCALELANVVCVAAVARGGELAGFSNYGARSVDVGAPGTEILSTVPHFETEFEDLEPQSGLPLWEQSPAGRWYATTEGEIGFEDPPLAATSTLAVATPPNLTGLERCKLAYGMFLDTVPDRQRLFVDVSADGVDWRPVQQSPYGYSGSSQGRVLPRAEPLVRVDGQPAAHVRFRVEVAPGAEDTPAEIFLQKPRVICVGPQPAGGAYGFLQGTSMASPHVAGVAALAWDAYPGASVADVRAALLGSAIPTPALAGRTVTGGRVSAPGVLEALEPDPVGPPAPPAPPAPPDPVAPTERRAVGMPAARGLRVNRAGRVAVRVRCRTVGAKRCRGRLVLIGRVRLAGRGSDGRPPVRRVVLGVRRYALREGATAARAVWLRPRAARLLRAGRARGAWLRVATRQPAGEKPRVLRRQARVQLRGQVRVQQRRQARAQPRRRGS